MCKIYNKSSVRTEMFNFGHIDWTWDKRCKDAQDRHYKEVAKWNNLQYYTKIIRNVCSEVDTLVLSQPNDN